MVKQIRRSSKHNITYRGSKRNDFICNHKLADKKMFVYIYFLCDNFHMNKVIIYQILMLL